MKVLVVGGGQVGSYLAGLLRSNGHEVRVVENREKVFEKLKSELPEELLVFGSGSDSSVLERAGIAGADVVAAVTGADEINLVVSTLAKMEFGVQRVVARVNNPRNAWLFNTGMGVDVGVNQAELMAHFVVEEMNVQEMFTLLKFGHGDYSLVQIQVQPDSPAAGRPVRDLAIPQQTVLIAITRGDDTVVPKGDTRIEPGDHILSFTDARGRQTLGEIFG